jgi:hypothetical protein
MTNRIVIFVQGGVVQVVYADAPEKIDVVVCDDDLDAVGEEMVSSPGCLPLRALADEGDYVVEAVERFWSEAEEV